MRKKTLFGRWRKAGIIALTGTMIFTGTGCSFIFPEEEEERKIRMVSTAEAVEYDMQVVETGDVVNSKRFYATYQQSVDAEVSFSMDDEIIGHVYVKQGDTVQEGDVLAQLDIGNTEELLERLLYDISVNEKKIADLEELKKYDINALYVRYTAGMAGTYADYSKALTSIDKQYTNQEKGIRDDLRIQYMKQEKYEKKINESYLYAPISGEISVLTDNLEGSKTVADKMIAKIIDTQECYFVTADMEKYKDYFTGDESIIVTYMSEEFETTPQYDEENKRVKLYLDDPSVELAIGIQGVYHVTLEERHDVLNVSKDCVFSNSGKQFVYILDENGIRTSREVTTGISGGGRIEIIDGLKAGDMVIAE